MNIHTFENTSSHTKTTQPTSHSIPKQAYYIINSTYNKLTIRTPHFGHLGQHKTTLIFHYTNSHHLSFGEHLHYLDFRLLEVAKLGSQLHFFLFPNFSTGTHT